MYQDIHKANFWNFWKNCNFLLFIDIEWLEMIVSNKKWSLLMILTTKKAAYIAKFAEFVWFVWLCSNVQTVFCLPVQFQNRGSSPFFIRKWLVQKEQHFSIISKSVSCGFYMKKNVAFTLISFAVLKWDECLSVQLLFELSVQIGIPFVFYSVIYFLLFCDWLK